MAGMSRIEACNEMLETVGEWPFSVLDSSGTWPNKVYTSSVLSVAERTLDRVCREVLTRGTVDNVLRNQSVIPATGSGPYEYTFAGAVANVLDVQGWGADEGRSFSVTGAKLFDVNKGTTFFTTNTAISLHIFINKDFTDLSPKVQQEVVKEAKLAFQRYWGEDKGKDIQISQERDIARAAKGSALAAPSTNPYKLEGMGPFGPALAQQPRQ